MLIYIHSAGRANLSLPTLDILMAGMCAKDVRLVVQAKEADDYAGRVPKKQLVVLPPAIKTLSPTRQWILDNTKSPAFMLMDDDLQFATRRPDDNTKFNNADPAEVAWWIGMAERYLKDEAHVGFMAREGANRNPQDMFATRMMRVLGYNTKMVRKVGARFDRLITKQDFDMTLQLLRAGLPNRVMAGIVHNQKGSNTAGGCSAYRTAKVMDESAHALAKLHPGFVKVVEKETKTAWGGGVRTDVQISWKKALESSNAR